MSEVIDPMSNEGISKVSILTGNRPNDENVTSESELSGKYNLQLYLTVIHFVVISPKPYTSLL